MHDRAPPAAGLFREHDRAGARWTRMTHSIKITVGVS